MRIAIVLLIVLLILTNTAFAGPAMIPEFVCKGNVAAVEVVSVDHGTARLRIARARVLDGRTACGDERWHPEGCFVQPAVITAKGDLTVGRAYLATLEPSGGADCSTTATATHWIPLELWTRVVGVFSLGP